MVAIAVVLWIGSRNGLNSVWQWCYASFVLLLVAERTFGWLNRSRRLSKSYERFIRTEEACVYIAVIRIMLRRLA
jgi:hypothetical protein